MFKSNPALTAIPPKQPNATLALVTAVLLAMVLRPDAALAALFDSAVGAYSASGSVVVGPSATSHRVTCSFSASKQGPDALGFRGDCRAYLLVSRSISADLVIDPRSNAVTGTYKGARVGTARLSGKMRGPVMDLVITWPAPVYGDTTASMTITMTGPDRLRIVVMDRIGADGPMRATTDLSLERETR